MTKNFRDDPDFPSKLPESLHPQLVEEGMTAVLKIRQEIFDANGRPYIVREFDSASKRLLRVESFRPINGKRHLAINFDGKSQGNKLREISREYYNKAGELCRIDFYRKNGTSLKEIELIENGQSRLVHGRKRIEDIIKLPPP